MISTYRLKISNLFEKRNERSQKIIKNILMSVGIKGGSIVIGLLLVPMTINYINPLQYGIWLTVSSIISWMNFFDIGMGNGLRNKLTTSIALGEYDNAKKYVSTTYATLCIISSLLFIIFWFINPHIDWRKFLNIPTSVSDNINLVILIVFSSFCLQFVIQLINTVLTSIHEPAIAGLISFIGQVMLLLTIFILKNTFLPGSLQVLVLALTAVPILILLVASIILYATELKHFAPSLKSVDFKYARNILEVGGAFFVIQIGALILFQTNNIIITKIIGPEAVTQFNVAYKLFSVVIMAFTIIMTPYWSAFTDAFAKKDFLWMKKSMTTLRKIWAFIAIIIVPLIVVISDYLFKIWLNDSVSIPFNLSIAMGLYVIFYTCLSLNCFFLNGVGKLKIQLYLYIIVSVINVPLGIYLGKNFGLQGVVFSNVIIFVAMNVVLWIQTNKVLNNEVSGIWNS
ncbi:lipopolysaccharide biosynthesis protein [Dyadobacter frigoris]|uniref:Polysaccharide biosynthesis protein n=1 Tax=Dyadobacter frigoris TaxID=2576211 RepID=A0A4U6CTT3_9BACT|nr:oligosaccharide flippase family protein [Dyadobacter frigoris]TKT87656.1 hypothetical protein FDK13_29155 [Dyadobacter frigoris]